MSDAEDTCKRSYPRSRLAWFWCARSLLVTLCVWCVLSQAVAQQESRPIVRQLTAEPVSATRIRLTWRLQKPFNARSLLVYRDTQPFATRTQLGQVAPIAELKPNSNYYVDTVQNYREYYYAVIARDADGRAYDIVLPSINATVSGVRVQLPELSQPDDAELAEEKQFAAGQLRELPLPYLNMLGSQQRKPNRLQPSVLEAGRALAERHLTPVRERLPPHIFDEDMISPSGGDEYFLFEILKDSFIHRDYAQAVRQLQQFLSINRSEATTTRAAFYLGESLYYCGKYRQALMMFLFVEEDEPTLTKKWIQSTLDLYELPPEA